MLQDVEAYDGGVVPGEFHHEGWLRPLHAEGDPRAARIYLADDAWPFGFSLN